MGELIKLEDVQVDRQFEWVRAGMRAYIGDNLVSITERVGDEVYYKQDGSPRVQHADVCRFTR